MYRLTSARFRRICDQVATQINRGLGWHHGYHHGRHIAELCDSPRALHGDRVFRMSRAVADWIDAEDPILPVFATIG